MNIQHTVSFVMFCSSNSMTNDVNLRTERCEFICSCLFMKYTCNLSKYKEYLCLCNIAQNAGGLKQQYERVR